MRRYGLLAGSPSGMCSRFCGGRQYSCASPKNQTISGAFPAGSASSERESETHRPVQVKHDQGLLPRDLSLAQHSTWDARFGDVGGRGARRHAVCESERFRGCRGREGERVGSCGRWDRVSTQAPNNAAEKRTQLVGSGAASWTGPWRLGETFAMDRMRSTGSARRRGNPRSTLIPSCSHADSPSEE